MIKPIFLLADSQLLFWKGGDRLFTDRIRELMESSTPRAAYLGASNGDKPEFYAIFQDSMAGIGVSACRMVPTRPSDDDRQFLRDADLVLLAGGSAEQGWRAFEENGCKELISQKRYEGAVLVGVSAGAVQLGLGTLLESSTMQKLPLFQFAPFYVSAHDESADWWDLRALVNMAGEGARGIGIPTGGGAVYHPDGTLEPIRKNLVELYRAGEQLVENVLLPSLTSGGPEANGGSLRS